jgi:hypothetical protein
MSRDVLDDWIACLLSTRSNREVSKLVHVGQDRVQAVRAAQADDKRILHQIGRPTKATPQIKQAVIKLTLQHLNFADLHKSFVSDSQFVSHARQLIHN